MSLLCFYSSTKPDDSSDEKAENYTAINWSNLHYSWTTSRAVCLVGRAWILEPDSLAVNSGSAFTFCDLRWLLIFSKPVFSSVKAKTTFYGIVRIRRNTQMFSISFILNSVYSHSFKNLNSTHFKKSVRTVWLGVTDFLERRKKRYWFCHSLCIFHHK